MAGKFKWQKFSTVDINDSFFVSLKVDYLEFTEWFEKKQKSEKSALVYNDDEGVGAFLYLKRENIDDDESILIADGVKQPNIPRLKIGTLRLAERVRKQRLGEGALGVALWYWRDTKFDEIYVTVYEKHTELIKLFERFGFSYIGKNDNNECVYIKNRNNLDLSDPYKCFPFISNNFVLAGLVPINDIFHDKLFPYSELAGGKQEIIETTAGNGITKVFIAFPKSTTVYNVGMPVFIYRVYNGAGQKTYKSVITSYCTICKIVVIKEDNFCRLSLDDFINQIGNKSIYSTEELKELYNKKHNLVAIELIYNGYFGKGHNVTHYDLNKRGLFADYPYNITYRHDKFIEILEMGDTNVQNTIID